MTFPNYPNPARRAKILEAQQLRMQGLTIRQIAQRMNCSVSTVHGYLRDYELFGTDLIQELATDQIVTHLIHLGDANDPNHEQRRADLHELRLLLTALPQIRRDGSDRSTELLQAGVAVDRYGERYPKPDRLHPPTPEETEQMEQPGPLPQEPDPDQPLAYIPDPVPAPAPEPEPIPQPEQNRTEPNKTEQHPDQNPAQDATSDNSTRNSLPPDIQNTLDDVEQQLQEVLKHRDWLNDYPQHNPWHPERQQALKLVEKRDALLAQATHATEPVEARA